MRLRGDHQFTTAAKIARLVAAAWYVAVPLTSLVLFFHYGRLELSAKLLLAPLIGAASVVIVALPLHGLATMLYEYASEPWRLEKEYGDRCGD